MRVLHIDLETYSSVPIRTNGAYKYTASPDFEILLFAYAYDDDDPVKIVDLAMGEQLPPEVEKDLLDPKVKKAAHNAVFERLSLNAYGYETEPEEWICTAILASHAGLPLGLDAVSTALDLDNKKDAATGKRLIKFFCCPCKPSKANGYQERNMPKDFPAKWEAFKGYCIRDVEAEQEIYTGLARFPFPSFERRMYALDQRINDRGIKIDMELVHTAMRLDAAFRHRKLAEVKELTGLDNPNAPKQLAEWLSLKMGKDIKSLTKDIVTDLLGEAKGAAGQVLRARQELGKTSVKKYASMLNCSGEGYRARGTMQFYAARTARWAGRLIQVQNLPQNHLEDLDGARNLVLAGDLEAIEMVYGSVPGLLSQLIRTAIIPRTKHTFAVADYSAIEARVIAWIAGEKWRLDVFNTHGKIYEASASMMFGVPIASVTKGSELRQKGKVSELALGYQGGWSALKKMGGEKMGLDVPEMKKIVTLWRKANPAIVELWANVEACAHKAVATRSQVVSQFKGLTFEAGEDYFRIVLPSGRSMYYREPRFSTDRFGQPTLTYMGVDSLSKKWARLETYGGKLVENIVQAIARDLLADALIRLDEAGFMLNFHVHDEAIAEVPKRDKEDSLALMCEIMGTPVKWAKGLPLRADGYTTDYYKKD